MSKKNNLPLIIDDTPIRKGLFKTAADILKKIEKLEKERDNFHDKEQSLFRDWYNLTFRTELQRAEILYREYEELANFHNSVLAQAQLKDQSFREALAALKREQKAYEKATETQKKKIEAERLKREEHLKESILKDEAESRARANKKSEKEQRKAKFYFFEDLLAALSNREGHKILKMWHEATDEMRAEAEENFQELRGVSLTAFIERLEKEKIRHEELNQPAKPAPPPGFQKEQDIKVLYRKLARRLHPDVAKTVPNKKITAAWIQQVWLKVQAAYKAQDVEALQRLDLTTLIRMEELSNLTLDEIRASHIALSQEFQELRFSIRDFKKHPAWKFSTKTNLEALKRKIREQLRRDVEPLRNDVERLREVYGRGKRF